MKKLFVAFLCVIMVMVFLPTMAFAAEGDVMAEDAFREALKDGETVDLGGATVTLEAMLSLTDGGSYAVKNGTIAMSESFTSNDSNNKTIAVQGDDTTLSLENVTVVSAAGNRGAIFVGTGAHLDATNLVVDNSSSDKGAIIINSGASATFSGTLDLKLGGKSWYGINVDGATADFAAVTSFKCDGEGTQSAVCLDSETGSKGVATGIDMTQVDTLDGQTAFVPGENLAQFVDAKDSDAKTTVTKLTLNADVQLSKSLNLREGTEVVGNGYTISGTAAIGRDNVVTVLGDGVEIANVTIKTDAANKSALHVYLADDVVVDGVTLDTTTTAGGAGMVVNGSNVTVRNGIKFINGENTWGGVNVDTKNGDASLTFGDKATVTTEGVEKNVIYQDAGQAPATITGAEQAGLVKNEDGSYVKDTTTCLLYTSPSPRD